MNVKVKTIKGVEQPMNPFHFEIELDAKELYIELSQSNPVTNQVPIFLVW